MLCLRRWSDSRSSGRSGVGTSTIPRGQNRAAKGPIPTKPASGVHYDALLTEFRSLDLVSRIRIRLDPNYFVRFVYESVTRIRTQPLVCTEHRHQTDKENPKRLVCITTL